MMCFFSAFTRRIAQRTESTCDVDAVSQDFVRTCPSYQRYDTSLVLNSRVVLLSTVRHIQKCSRSVNFTSDLPSGHPPPLFFSGHAWASSSQGRQPVGPQMLSSCTLQAWAKRIDEDATILALKSTMLETLFGEAVVLTGRLFSTYADLRASIIRSLDDKLSVSMVETSSLSTTNVVQNLAENTHKKVRRKSREQRYAIRKRSCLPKSSSFERATARAEGQKGKKAKKGKHRQKQNQG